MDDQAPGQLFGLVLAWALALLFAALGAWFVVASVRDGIRFGRLRRRGIRTTAVVVGHESSTTRDLDHPVFQFTDQHGRRQTFTYDRPSSTFVAVGRHREVVYLPDRPEDAALYGSTSPLQGVGSVLFGAVFLLVGLTTAVGLWIGGGHTVHLRLPPSAGEIALAVTRSLGILGIGIGWIAVLSPIRKVLSLRRNGIRTVGTVVARHDSRSGITVEFTDADGRKVQFIARDRWSGAQLPVLYREHAPEAAQIDSLSHKVKLLVFLFFFSLLFLVAFAV